MKYQIANQKALRSAFWRENGHCFSGKPVKYSNGEWTVDVQMAWIDFIDAYSKSGIISEALASLATLEG